MINLIDTISSKFSSVPSTNECLKILDEYVSDDMLRNHHDMILKECGTDKVEHLHRDIKTLFINCYVNHGFNGSYDKNFHDFIMNKLPLYHQCMQYLSHIYSTSRSMKIYGV